jgi:hypothetical protein
MLLRTLSHLGHAWSEPLPTELDSSETLVLAFGSPGYHTLPGPLEELTRAFPRSHVLGCSTSGEIHDTKLLDNSIAAAVIRFEHSRLRRADAVVTGPDQSCAAGETIASTLGAADLAAVFLLSDGLSVNGSELVRGLNKVLPSSVVVTGGLAGDGSRFAQTWTLAGGGPRAQMITAVGIYGNRARIGHGSRGGWDIFGLERQVTRSTGNVLHELDGRPALALYKEYLGERSTGLPATALLFPLALRTPNNGKEVVRTVLAVDEASQSMTFAGDIPQGARVRLMRANFDRVIQGACDAGSAATASTGGGPGPVLAVAISCVGRRLVLGERTEEEIEAVKEALPRGAAQIGFYSYGEISPQGFGSCDLHNQTMTLTTFAEG